MRRPLVLAALLATAGCPLPQPLPAVQGSGPTIAPPRIVVDGTAPRGAVVRVGTACGPAVQPFSAVLDDSNVDEVIEARWFVDYDAGSTGLQGRDELPPAPGGTTARDVPPYLFRLADHDPARPHVVELVVSNGFYRLGGEPADAPRVNRTPQPGYETQVFRWVVVYDAGAPCP